MTTTLREGEVAQAQPVRLIVYGLTDPRTSEVRYIGKSSYGLSRPRAAGKRTKYEPGHKSNWILSLQALGLTYGIVVLETATDEVELKTLERFWIAQARGLGWPLTNLTDGGEGAAGAKFTAEHKAKLAATKLGKPRSAEAKAKVSEGLRRFWAEHPEHKRPAFTDEHRARLSTSHRGKTPTEETRAKMSAAQRRRQAKRRASSN